MTGLLRKSLRVLFLSAGLCTCFASLAQDKDAFDPFSADIEENVSTPAVPPKYSEAVAAAMSPLGKALKDAGLKVSKVRSGEVVMAEIPASALFAPNSRELRLDAGRFLSPLLPYVKRTDKYKVVIAAHADNTGDSAYADDLTADRANAVDAYFEKETGEDSQAIPYGIGSDEPIAPNVGVKNRASNRRIEIYFIPTKEFIDKARKK